MKRNFLFYTSAFAVGAIGYPLLEVAFRGRSHISMALAGGLSLVFIFYLGRQAPKASLLLRAALSALFITALEFSIGVVVNLNLHLGVWDYTGLPLNLWGQICLPFTGIWFLLSLPLCALAKRLSFLAQTD